MQTKEKKACEGSSCAEKCLFRQEHTLMLLLIYGHQSKNLYRVCVCVCTHVSGVAQELQQPPVVILILLVTMLRVLLGS